MNKEVIKTELIKRAKALAIQMGHRGESIEDIGHRVITGPYYADRCADILYEVLKEMKVTIEDEKMNKEIGAFFKPIITDLLYEYAHGT